VERPHLCLGALLRCGSAPATSSQACHRRQGGANALVFGCVATVWIRARHQQPPPSPPRLPLPVAATCLTTVYSLLYRRFRRFLQKALLLFPRLLNFINLIAFVAIIALIAALRHVRIPHALIALYARCRHTGACMCQN
jgi:hypothetical protein